MLYEVTNGEAIVTSDVGQHQMLLRSIYSTNRDNGLTRAVWELWVWFACCHGSQAGISGD